MRRDAFLKTLLLGGLGAEVIRMMRTMAGPERFRAGCDLYFERHDGQAATCDDFVAALEDASGEDLSRFKIWYSQAGTPKVRARLEHDPASGQALLHLSQSVPPTPGQPVKAPMPIPLKTALIGDRLIVASWGFRGGIPGRAQRKTPPPVGSGDLDEAPGDDLLLHACAHYHRRGCVSLPSSGWDRVVPQRYGHQGDGWRVRSAGLFWSATRARSRVRCCVKGGCSEQ